MLEEFVLPILICVLLPIIIAWLALNARKHEVDRKSEILLKAIENGTPVDPDYFKSKKEPKTIKQTLLGRLTGACVTTFLGIAFLASGFLFKDIADIDSEVLVLGSVLLAIGVALFTVFFISKGMLAKEIEAEENNLDSYEK